MGGAGIPRRPEGPTSKPPSRQTPHQLTAFPRDPARAQPQVAGFGQGSSREVAWFLGLGFLRKPRPHFCYLSTGIAHL